MQCDFTKGVKQLIFFLVLGTTLLSSCAIRPLEDKINPQELQEDFVFFRSKMQKFNPGLYKFIDRQKLEAYWDSLQSTLNRPLTQRDFSQVLNKAIKPIQERHVSIGFHKKSAYSMGFKKGERKVLPVFVYYLNDDAYILRNFSTDSTLQPPIKLLAINGMKVKEIRDSIKQFLTSDAGVNTWQDFEINARFTSLYHQYIWQDSVFNLSYLNNREEESQTYLQGMSTRAFLDSLKKHNKKIYGYEKPFPAVYHKFYDSLQTGYLRIKTFNKKKLRRSKSKILHDVKLFFDEVQKNDTEHVIIDLRGNTGGRVKYLLRVMQFIQANEDKEVYALRQWYKWPIKRHRIKEWKEKTKKQARKPFLDKVYLLVDGGSYSASVSFTNLAKKYANATVFGTATGGRKSGTTAGKHKVITLKNSWLTVRIPKVCFTYFSNENSVGAVKPDVEVNPELNDFFTLEADYQLKAVFTFIKDN